MRPRRRPAVLSRAIAIVAILLARAVPATAQANDLGALDDDFEDSATLAQWIPRHVAEAPGVDPLEIWAIDPGTHPGRMLMRPYTVTWYGGYKGPLVYKSVSGDFAITTEVQIDNHAGTGVPSSHYSLGGLMIRTPIASLSDPENYVFLSLGFGQPDGPGNPGAPPHFEAKTTIGGASTLELTPSAALTAKLQIARIGSTVVTLLRRPGQAWEVRRRYSRPDMPATLEVGFVAYTDWDKVSTYSTSFHNTHVLHPPIPGDPSSNPGLPFAPDIVASFEYARFVRPIVPAGVDPATASDAQLLSFLGANADVDVRPYCAAKINSLGCAPTIGCSGSTSLSGADSLHVRANGIVGQTSGFLAWGLAPNPPTPFTGRARRVLGPSPLGGRSCVLAGRRAGALSSGGTSGACDGVLDFHFSHALMGANGLSAGTRVYAQFWYDDPLHPDGSGVGHTGGVEFLIDP